MWVLSGGLKVQNHLLNFRVAHRQASWQRVPTALQFLICQVSQNYRYGDMFLGLEKATANFLTLQKSKTGHVTEAIKATGQSILTIHSSKLQIRGTQIVY